LNFVKSFSAAGNTICFDYMTHACESIHAGEPFIFWIERGKIESFLLERGFHTIDHLGPEDIEKKFLTLKDGSIAENALPYFCFMNASVTE